MDALWLVVVMGGPIILAAIIAYALLRRRRLSSTERLMRKDATERVYDETKQEDY
jgi:hypothetical protein